MFDNFKLRLKKRILREYFKGLQKSLNNVETNIKNGLPVQESDLKQIKLQHKLFSQIQTKGELNDENDKFIKDLVGALDGLLQKLERGNKDIHDDLLDLRQLIIKLIASIDDLKE